MSWIISKKPNNLTEAEADINTTNKPPSKEDEEENNNNSISSHLYLKPVHTSGTLDKQVVLRRIRHRKRVKNLRTTANSLLGYLFPSKKTKEDHNNTVVKVDETTRWIDDAFAAP